jgi:2-dehydro-3-deoxygluconokinase
MTLDVVTLGETMAVLAPERVGPLRAATSGRLTVAGAESTVAIGVCRLGGTARWVGSLGEDELGELVIARLRAEGVDVRAERRTAATGLMIKERRTAATTRVHYYRAGLAGSQLAADQVNAAVLGESRWLHVTGITPALSPSAAEAVEAAVDAAVAAGTKVSFDVNHRTRLWSSDEAAGPLRGLAERADVVFATRSEAELLTGRPTRDDAAAVRQLADVTAGTVVLKRGDQGVLALEAGTRRSLEQAAYPVTVIDPVGAGDAFVAGYLAEASREGTLEACLRLGAAVAAVAISCDGDWEGLPTREEVQALFDADDIVR